MGQIDLHVHSNASDGTLSPAEVVKLAKKSGLEAIALTDHDTTQGIREASEEGRKSQMEVVPGIEMSCYYGEKELHILGYYIDYENADFLKGLEEIREERILRNEKMIALFQNDGFEITMEELYAGNPKTVVTRAHFARVLVEKGYVSDKSKAFDKYLSPGCKYYLPKPKVTPEMVFSLLNSVHAVIMLAHPFLYKMGDREMKECIEELQNMGLDGIEVYHSSHQKYQSDKLKEYIKNYHMIASGGSDFHGTNKPDIFIGKGRGNMYVDGSLLEKIKEKRKEK